MKAVKADQNRFEIDEPSLPRKRRRSECVDHYFQPSIYHFPENIQEVFLNSLKGELFQENLDVVMDIFCDDLNREELEARLITLKFYPDEPIIDAKELVKFLQGLTAAQRRLMPQVVILAKLLLIIPATNAVSERSFST